MKELDTLDYIQNILSISPNPIILCSFGKDSMVMLYLIRQIKKDIPVLFFKEPFFPKKYSFANEIIEKWNLTVYDFPPAFTDFISNNGDFEVINWYNGYGNAFLYVPTGIHKYEDGDNFICAREDLINKPKVLKYNFLWDTIFVGHKNNDKDPIFGITTLKDKTVQVQQMTLALPISEWSDEDIWDYILENKIFYNDKRYNKNDNFKEFDDKTYNNDYHPCCVLCLDNKQSEFIMCPKYNKFVQNISLTDEQNKFKIQNLLSFMGYMNSN